MAKISDVKVNDLSWVRKFSIWMLMNVPLGSVAPWFASYAFTGRFGNYKKVADGEVHNGIIRS